MKKSSKLTIEDLAEMMARAFAAQDGKIKTLKVEIMERFEGVDENFGRIRRDLLNLDDRFVNHHQFEKFAKKNGLQLL